MPTWQPNRQDVQWDHAAAQEAITMLQHVANQIDVTLRERMRVAEAAQVEWRGPHRQSFDLFLDETIRDAQRITSEYREAAARIAAACGWAQEEQQRRVRDRERWRDEETAERRARERR